jgi:hypothetical protein
MFYLPDGFGLGFACAILLYLLCDGLEKLLNER